MQCFSHGCSFLKPTIYPHQTLSISATTSNFDKQQIPYLPRSAHLVPVPRDDRFVGVGRTDDVQVSHALMGHPTSEQEDMYPDHVATIADILSGITYTAHADSG